ncbi:uroporphyrinogen-III synthase [Methylobacter sp. YRD-M1]|uniref:uroporphyrinogen-III synthase n=1 Tax=Methylobacter sp. YRD-M1 TaxID=2911520 RepID=UPI00227A4F5D|nr:uroporphyrinogen-III synthase [Methylobacter sp. YRD-M1]WAK01819.1 uroporphyrinogen-III synthase [Methylobacter sp. YRD-M1]
MSGGLNGARVLVTRPAHQAENLSRLIQARGGEAVRFPVLDIVARGNIDEVQDALKNLDNFQWVVFISPNAVNFALKANNGKIDRLKAVRCAAVGRATAQALEAAGLTVDAVPEQGYTSEALLAMPQMQQINGQSCLIVRGEGGREELANTLRSRGADVQYLEVYKRTIPSIDNSQVVQLLTQRRLDVITVTSGEALQNLLIMLGEKNHQLLLPIPLVVVSDRIGQLAAGMGFKRIAVTENPADTAILETVTIVCNGE